MLNRIFIENTICAGKISNSIHVPRNVANIVPKRTFTLYRWSWIRLTDALQLVSSPRLHHSHIGSQLRACKPFHCTHFLWFTMWLRRETCSISRIIKFEFFRLFPFYNRYYNITTFVLKRKKKEKKTKLLKTWRNSAWKKLVINWYFLIYIYSINLGNYFFRLFLTIYRKPYISHTHI